MFANFAKTQTTAVSLWLVLKRLVYCDMETDGDKNLVWGDFVEISI